MGLFNRERYREIYRERQRAMYFLVILLIAPAFGMPSKSAGDGGEVVNEFQSLIDFSRETRDLLDNSQWIQEVFVSLNNTEQNLLDLEVELKTMPYADKTGVGLEDNLFPEYNNAKRYLRETGQKLREFAYKTVAEMRDLKTLFAAVDESQDSVLLQIAINKTMGFMGDTVEIFREANEKYQTAKNTFVDLKNSSTGSKDKVEKMLNKDSAEYRKWVKVVTEAVKEENNIPEKVQKLKAELDAQIERKEAEKIEKAEENKMAETEIEMTEIKKTDEVKEPTDKIHSAYAAAKKAIEARVKAQTEAAIERYNAKLEKLKEFTNSMLESGNNFEETIDKAMRIITEKIAKIATSTESANLVSENKETFLTKFQDISSDLTTEIDDLKKSAETFLTRE